MFNKQKAHFITIYNIYSSNSPIVGHVVTVESVIMSQQPNIGFLII